MGVSSASSVQFDIAQVHMHLPDAEDLIQKPNHSRRTHDGQWGNSTEMCVQLNIKEAFIVRAHTTMNHPVIRQRALQTIIGTIFNWTDEKRKWNEITDHKTVTE